MCDKSLNPNVFLLTVERPVSPNMGDSMMAVVSAVNKRDHNYLLRELIDSGEPFKGLTTVRANGTEGVRSFIIADTPEMRTVIQHVMGFTGFYLIRIDGQGCAFKVNSPDDHGRYLGAYKRLPSYMRKGTSYLRQRSLFYPDRSWVLKEGYFGRSAA